VAVDRFELDSGSATAFSLDVESQERLLSLFQEVLGKALAGEQLPRRPQGEGRCLSRDELETQRRLRPEDDVERELRAFWYLPWPGRRWRLAGAS